MQVSGRAALVTGGAQGLGKAFTTILLQHGAKVVFTDINEGEGSRTLQELQRNYGQNNVVFIKADVTSQPQMAESFEMAKSSFGQLDILINNAGVGNEGEQWENTVDVNLKGPIRCTRLALDYMRRDRGGQGGIIINIASAGGLRPNPFGPVYCASKAGLIMFTRSLASDPELQENGVRVSTLCPSFADTALVANIQHGTTTNTRKALEMVTSVGIMKVETVAEAMYDLLTDDTKNGAVLAVSKQHGRKYVPF